MCSGILPEMFAKTAPTSSLLPVPSCQQRRRRRCPHSPTLADSRSALLRLLRRLSARYPHEKNVTGHPRHSQYNRMYASRTFYCHEPRLRRSPLLRSSFLLIKWRLRRRLFFFLYLARGPALRASSPASQAVRSLSAREKQMPPSASLVFLSCWIHYTPGGY